MTRPVLEVVFEASALMAVTYGMVWFAYGASRHLGSSPHWSNLSWGGWIAFWVLVAAGFFGGVWAEGHKRDCDEDFPGAKFMDRRDPAYSIVRECEAQNEREVVGRMLAVALVLGIASFSGVRKGQQGYDTDQA